MTEPTQAAAATALELRPQGQPLTPAQPFSLTPRTLDEAFRLAEILSESEFVPKDYRGKPANVLVAVQWGHEVGLKPLQALQNIAVINGRPSLWGDAMLALVRASPLCEYVVESVDAAGTAICQVKRRGEPEQIRTFSAADAQTAGLATKDGPWKTAPKRMRQMRARAFALRDVFPDVLKGMAVAEESLDLPAESIATPLDQIAGTASPVPKDLLEAAQKAAAGGHTAFAAWFADEKNGGHTTQIDRTLLAPRMEEFRATWRAADQAVADAAAAEVTKDTQSQTGATFGDDTSGAA